MKRINEFINNNLLGLVISIIILSLTIIGCLILSSNKYEDDISKLKLENKKLNHELQTSYNTIYDLRNEHQECEYYIVPTEDGFVIDGQLYEKVEGFEAYE